MSTSEGSLCQPANVGSASIYLQIELTEVRRPGERFSVVARVCGAPVRPRRRCAVVYNPTKISDQFCALLEERLLHMGLVDTL